MNFKTVHGLGRDDYAKKALDAAMSNLHNPEYVDSWIAWFDKQSDDTQRNQCEQCAPGVVCPDDCPQPEFYLGDLEEVAHMTVTRIESALVEYLRVKAPAYTATGLPAELKVMFDMIRTELSEPGYVEGLLPL